MDVVSKETVFNITMDYLNKNKTVVKDFSGTLQINMKIKYRIK